MDYAITINVSSETNEGVGFAAEEETNKSLRVEADLDQKTVEVERDDLGDGVEQAVESFLDALDVSEIDLEE